jgi:neural Wiskott-Aldrich syndrome protein
MLYRRLFTMLLRPSKLLKLSPARSRLNAPIIQSTSKFTASEKRIVKRVARTSKDEKILSVGMCRIYIADPRHSQWEYTGHQGAIVFTRARISTGRTTFWFKMVDLFEREMIWKHELYSGLKYKKTTAWMGVWEGETEWFGFVFSSEIEADHFHRKVNTRQNYRECSFPNNLE